MHYPYLVTNILPLINLYIYLIASCLVLTCFFLVFKTSNHNIQPICLCFKILLIVCQCDMFFVCFGPNRPQSISQEQAIQGCKFVNEPVSPALGAQRTSSGTSPLASVGASSSVKQHWTVVLWSLTSSIAGCSSSCNNKNY